MVFALNEHPRYKLVMIFNRDEDKNRDSEPIHWLNNNVLAGRDEKEGGSWFGITRRGRIAYLTNFRDPDSFRKDAKSRGFIVKSFLLSNDSPEVFIDNLRGEVDEYNSFNLIVGANPDEMFYFSSVTGETKRIRSGIHGLSNGLLDEPWPKVEKLKAGFKNIVSKEEISIERLFELLEDRERFPIEMLPNTGVGEELEVKLSPIFVDFEGYGTISSAVLLISKNNDVILREKRFVEPKTDLIYRFAIV